MADRLLLIDGNNLVHRAYHALPAMSTTDGQPTNAIYGFAQMVLSLLEDQQPQHVAVAFDPPGPTFRHEADERYKANRVEMEPELAAQMDLAREMTSALGLTPLEVPGFEADDVIGTLTRQAREQGHEVLILSGDRDMLQLVQPGVQVMASLKGIKDTKLYDEAAVREEYGVDPPQIVDIKALAGDSSDNIPGVPGIGPKGAVQLLQDFGTLDNLYANLDQVKSAAVRTKLEAGSELARLSQDLATIRQEIPLDLPPEQLNWRGPDALLARQLFARLEFNNLLARTASWGAAWEGDIREATEADLAALGKQAREVGHLTLVPLGEAQPGLALCADTQVAWLWLAPRDDDQPGGLFVDDTPRTLPPELAALLSDPGLPKWGCRLKEAARLLQGFAVRLAGCEFDGEIADYLLAPQRTDHTILLAVARDLGWWVPQTGGEVAGRPLPQARAAVEALAVERLREELLRELEQAEVLTVFTDIEMPLVEVLAEMEGHGIAVDARRLKALGAEFDAEMAKKSAAVFEIAGEQFNLESPKQVGEVLFDKLKLGKGKRTKTGWSTNAEVLEELAEEHPIAGLILEYRELAKLRSTYVEGLLTARDPQTGRLHTTFEQTVTSTGRLSSRSPNLQNIPARSELGRQIRSCFTAAEGLVLIKADYSQVELRLLAHFTGDENLLAAFNSGEDIHRRTAALIFGVTPDEVTADMRRVAKTVNFAVLYGMGSVALSKQLSVKRNEAQEFIDNYFANLSSVKQFLEGIVEQGRAAGYVSTLMGRRRPMPELHSADRGVAAYAERAAANTPLQGSAADIVKVAMLRLSNILHAQFPHAAMLLQVHDELVVEAPRAQAGDIAHAMREAMENVVTLRVPLLVDVQVGDNWRDVERVE